jgi:hypothetical protein
VRDTAKYNAVDYCSGVLSIGGAAAFGILGHRLWRYLGVKKLRWMTEEDVKKFQNIRQYL